MQSYHKPPSQDGPATPPIDLPALQTAVCRNTPEAQQMQACIAVQLQQVDTTNLVSVHRHVNRILLEAAAAAFPKQPPADNRVSAQPAFRVTARSVWHMYRNLKQPRVCTPRAIFEKWKLAAAFARASKILRKQSHYLKKQFYESQVDQARTVLSGPEQMQRIVAYGNETFAAKDIAQELRKLGVSKAVPRHIAPAAVWKQCSQDLGCILSHAICHHMQPGTTGELDEDWKSSYVVWIPKPGKPQLDVTSLRPIGLSSPASKALAGSLRHHLLRGLEPALRMTPQFAYAKSRGTADALLRAHMHFEAVAQLVQDTQCTRMSLPSYNSSTTVQQVLTLFADDVWGAWEIRSARDLDQAIADVSLVLEALETLSMTINYSKTAILLKLVGKDARRLKQKHTFMKAGQLHLRVSVHGRECGIPIKDQHEYLGTIVTYRHRHQRNMQHRLKACTVRHACLPALQAAILEVTARCEHLYHLIMMLGHDPDFALNEEAAIFANCWPEAPEFLLSPSASLSPDHRSQKRPRPNQQPHWPGRHPSNYHGHRGQPFGSSSYGPQRPPPQHDPLRLLTRVVLQQEQTISRLRHDKAFVLFMKQGEDGTLGALMSVAKEWNNKKSQENSTIRSPLRTVLLSSMIGALLKLAQQAVATEDNKQKMVTAEWLTANSEWTYRVWNHAERRLVVDTNKTPLQHAEATRILTFLFEHLTGEAIQRFNSTVTLPKLEQQGANIATFALEVSLSGKEAAELYHSFERLCGSAIMNLIGVSMKKDTLPQTPAAKQLANLFYQHRQQLGPQPSAQLRYHRDYHLCIPMK
ncbi:unnamed protein product, partial [Symbiodinium necroappetens]